MNLHLSLLQLDLTFGQPEKNRQHIYQAFQQLKEETELVILPEMWNTCYDLVRFPHLTSGELEKTKAFLKQLSLEFDTAIVGGSVAISEKNQYYNSMFVTNSQGNIIGEYKKVHLFRLMQEEKFLSAGNEVMLFPMKEIIASGVICYDIRFPEWIRKICSLGAQMLFVSAQWPISRIKQWKALLVARAIENQAYVIAVNRVGKDPNNTFGGTSMIIDPTGEILFQASKTSEVIHQQTVDLDDIQKVRGGRPIFEDRRSNLY